jgi:hypothetical protein
MQSRVGSAVSWGLRLCRWACGEHWGLHMALVVELVVSRPMRDLQQDTRDHCEANGSAPILCDPVVISLALVEVGQLSSAQRDPSRGWTSLFESLGLHAARRLELFQSASGMSYAQSFWRKISFDRKKVVSLGSCKW